VNDKNNKLRDQALEAISVYLSETGWQFGGDQCDFMWIDPLCQNLHYSTDAFCIQLDREMVKMIEKNKLP